jgi:hypothetical protein
MFAIVISPKQTVDFKQMLAQRDAPKAKKITSLYNKCL